MLLEFMNYETLEILVISVYYSRMKERARMVCI